MTAPEHRDPERFWAIIEATLDDPTGPMVRLDEHDNRLEAELGKLSFEAYSSFLVDYWLYHRATYRHDLWAVAYVVMGACGDDAFDAFRTWLITRGRVVYERALEDPESLCSEFRRIPEGDIPLMECFFEAHFSERFGEGANRQLYDTLELPPRAFADPENAWDEDDLERICPKVFAEFDDNDRF